MRFDIVYYFDNILYLCKQLINQPIRRFDMNNKNLTYTLTLALKKAGLSSTTAKAVADRVSQQKGGKKK